MNLDDLLLAEAPLTFTGSYWNSQSKLKKNAYVGKHGEITSLQFPNHCASISLPTCGTPWGTSLDVAY